MADAAVEFVLENLQKLLLYHAHLIEDAMNEIEKLEREFRLFRAFLRDSAKKRRKDDSLQELVYQIRDVVYEAEDIVDAFVTQAAEVKSTKYFLRAFKTPLQLHRITVDVDSISAKVRKIYGNISDFDFENLSIGDGDPDKTEVPILRQDNVVGLEDEEEKIMEYLSEEMEQLDVISVIGMPGLGKTTLVGKIFNNEVVQYEFPTRIWVCVSQEFNKRDIFLAIMREFTNEDMYGKTEKELEQLVYDHLQGCKFLIVMDDVWTPAHWKEIEIALPKNNNLGKVLITSRHVEVARCANRSRAPHKLRFLTHRESWLLLQYEIFGKPECPPHLRDIGYLIAASCDGLPLAIVVIGGILVKNSSPSHDISATRKTWLKVSESVDLYLHGDPGHRMEYIIEMSYHKLPYRLKTCFLYLGMFPEDFEIPAWKLTRMWIAEGFIQQKDGISQEEIAENYLDVLISRNLLRVDKRKSDGRVKTCRIHDMLHDFCKVEARNERENFLQEMISTDDGFERPVSEVPKYRRLCVHSNVLKFLSSEPFGPRVRSFACFSKDDITLPADQASAIPSAFKLLRVLDAKPIKFSRIPSEMYQLIHLRYITLSFNLAILPAGFAKLWNVQTLVFHTTSRTLEIKADIFEMYHLRHLKTNASASLPKPAKKCEVVTEIRTLGTIAPQSCTVEFFDRAPNVKELGIRGQLALLLEGKTGAFDNLVKLSNLENLKLINDVFPIPPPEGRLSGLPPPYQFPPKLKILTLAATFLDWDCMSILALLENLEVLKLKDKAFMGMSWKANDGGFRRLKVLHIGRTNLMLWEASGHHFPRLTCLALQNCEELYEIPIGLADIPSFQLLNLYRSNNAAASATKIREAKQIWNSEFKLSIFPPDE